MTDILFWVAIGFVGGTAFGWFFLPTPSTIQRWWVEKMGWKDRVP